MSEQMRAEFEAWADSKCMSLTRIKWDSGILSEYAYTATFDAWQVWQVAYQAGRNAEQAEVDQLRAELALLRKDWCDDDETIKQQALRVLDAAKVEGDSWSVPRGSALAEMMADKLVEVKAELAAAKAASVCPVEIAALGDADWEYSVGVKCKSDDDANKLFDWLWERMKDTPPPAT